ncbi:MAG TPA: VanZ family protein [Vicinamibacterales bacterium]|nr:VanZ family protein [Vicinamibacterales bacterium]
MATLGTRLAVASLAAATLVLGAPWLGEARAWLRATFPGHFVVLFNGAIVLIVATAAMAAIARVRERRGMRASLIGAAIAIAAAASWLTGTASASVNAVERFHFVAYGAITWLFYRAVLLAGAIDLSLVVLPSIWALIVATGDEAFQWFVPGRVGEIRDVFLNWTAIVAGLVFSFGVRPPARLSLHLAPTHARRVARAAAVLVLALAGLVHLVHLGWRVEDGSTTFKSRYRASELLRLSDDRAARWQSSPPPKTLQRFSREDQYLAEGLWHVRARNDAWATDIARAWRENEILERYFGPILDTPSHAAPASRWPPSQRTDAATRAGDRTTPFVSRAEPLPILEWRPWWLWGAAGLVSLLLILVGRRVGG